VAECVGVGVTDGVGVTVGVGDAVGFGLVVGVGFAVGETELVGDVDGFGWWWRREVATLLVRPKAKDAVAVGVAAASSGVTRAADFSDDDAEAAGEGETDDRLTPNDRRAGLLSTDGCTRRSPRDAPADTCEESCGDANADAEYDAVASAAATPTAVRRAVLTPVAGSGLRCRPSIRRRCALTGDRTRSARPNRFETGLFQA
jgi:hypothetical protein